MCFLRSQFTTVYDYPRYRAYIGRTVAPRATAAADGSTQTENRRPLRSKKRECGLRGEPTSGFTRFWSRQWGPPYRASFAGTLRIVLCRLEETRGNRRRNGIRTSSGRSCGSNYGRGGRGGTHGRSRGRRPTVGRSGQNTSTRRSRRNLSEKHSLCLSEGHRH